MKTTMMETVPRESRGRSSSGANNNKMSEGEGDEERFQAAMRATVMPGGGGGGGGPYSTMARDTTDHELELLRAQQEEELIQAAMDESLRVGARTNRNNNGGGSCDDGTRISWLQKEQEREMLEMAMEQSLQQCHQNNNTENYSRRNHRGDDDMPPPLMEQQPTMIQEEESINNNKPVNSLPNNADYHNNSIDDTTSVHTKNWLYPSGTKAPKKTTTEEMPAAAMASNNGSSIPTLKKPPPPSEFYNISQLPTKNTQDVARLPFPQTDEGSRRRRNSHQNRRHHRRSVSYDDADEYYDYSGEEVHHQESRRYNNNPHPTSSNSPIIIPQNHPLYNHSTNYHYNNRNRVEEHEDPNNYYNQQRNGDGPVMSSPSPGHQGEDHDNRMMAPSNYELHSSTRRGNNYPHGANSSSKEPPPADYYHSCQPTTGSRRRNSNHNHHRQHRRSVSYDDADEYYGEVYEEAKTSHPPSNPPIIMQQSMLDQNIPQNHPLYDDSADSSTRHAYENRRIRDDSDPNNYYNQQRNSDGPVISSPRSSPRQQRTGYDDDRMIAQSNYELQSSPRRRVRDFEDIPDTSLDISNPRGDNINDGMAAAPSRAKNSSYDENIDSRRYHHESSNLQGTTNHSKQSASTSFTHNSWGKIDATKTVDRTTSTNFTLNSWGNIDATKISDNQRHSIIERRRIPDDRMAYSSYENYQDGRRGGGGIPDYDDGNSRRRQQYDDRGQAGDHAYYRGHAQQTQQGNYNEEDRRMAYSSYDNGYYGDYGGRRTSRGMSRSLSPKRMTTSQPISDRRYYDDDNHIKSRYGAQQQQQQWEPNNNRIPSSADYYGQEEYDSRRNSRSPTRRQRREPKEEAPLYPKLDEIIVMTGEVVPKVETTDSLPVLVTPSTPNPPGDGLGYNNNIMSSGAAPSEAAAVACALGKFRDDVDPTKDFREAQAKLAKPGLQRHHTTGSSSSQPNMERSHTTDCAGITTNHSRPRQGASNSNNNRPDLVVRGGSGGSLSSRRCASPSRVMDRRDEEAKEWDTKMAAKLHDYRAQQQQSSSRGMRRSLSPAAGRSFLTSQTQQLSPGPSGLQAQSSSSQRRSSRSPFRKSGSTLGEGHSCSPSPKRSPMRKTRSNLDDHSFVRPISPGRPQAGFSPPMDDLSKDHNGSSQQSPKQKGRILKKLFSGSKEKK